MSLLAEGQLGLAGQTNLFQLIPNYLFNISSFQRSPFDVEKSSISYLMMLLGLDEFSTCKKSSLKFGVYT
jgi:hypothetical protein